METELSTADLVAALNLCAVSSPGGEKFLIVHLKNRSKVETSILNSWKQSSDRGIFTVSLSD